MLFADDAGEPDGSRYRDDLHGFYWTEGLSGLGWAVDAVPPLKGGSGVGIPSPPAIWAPANPVGRRLVVPSIGDAERLQGFPEGWTSPAERPGRNGPRWKLVGNAVTVGVADWLAGRLEAPGAWDASLARRWRSKRWPSAACGGDGEIHEVRVSTWPVRRPYVHLSEIVDVATAAPLSRRATSGFLRRAARSRLRFDEDFLLDAKEHATHDAGQIELLAG